MLKQTSIILIFMLLSFASCQNDKGENIRADGEWITGTEEEKLRIIEKQFRGFDKTMVETGYRYQELYWAGKDENWEYASYQLEKIRVAIENGLERRPNRALSAADFQNVVLYEMQEAIDQKNEVLFDKRFTALTTGCNSCHQKENLAFFEIKTPESRQSPIRR